MSDDIDDLSPVDLIKNLISSPHFVASVLKLEKEAQFKVMKHFLEIDKIFYRHHIDNKLKSIIEKKEQEHE